MKSVDLDVIREAFEVNENTGQLINKINRRKARSGEIAGTPRPDGYLQVCVNRTILLVHRVIFALENGYWSDLEIDHINGNKKDNRPSNLREATKSQNGANKRLCRNGLKGASWCKRAKKWRATLRKDGKQLHIGLFNTAHEAHEAYVSAAARYHGQYARAA
jgi:hypothetical protein